MKIRVELNKKYGTGFQLHCIASTEDGDPGNLDQVIDFQPYSLWKAQRLSYKALEICNRKLGTSYELQDVLETTMESLRVNARTDLKSARIYRKCVNIMREEVDTFLDDEEKAIEYLTDGFFLWSEECDQQSEDELKRFCEYISINGIPGGASKLFMNLTRLSIEDASEWIYKNAMDVLRKTNDVASMMDYVIE